MKESLNRRDFLKVAGASIGGALLGVEPPAHADEQEVGIELRGSSILDECRRLPLDIPDRIELTDEAQQCLTALAEFNTVSARLSASVSGISPRSKHDQMLHLEVEKVKKELWSTLAPFLGSKEPYLTERFYREVGLELPQKLLSYGMFIATANDILGSTTTDNIIAELPLFSIYQVLHVESYQQKQYGIDISTHIVRIRGPLVPKQLEETTKLPRPQSAFTMNQTIFVNEDLETNFYTTVGKSFDKISRQSLPRSPEDVFRGVQQGGNADNLVHDYVLSEFMKAITGGGIDRVLWDTTVNHELRHVFDDVRGILPVSTASMRTHDDLMRNTTSSHAHAEINGILGGVRYAAVKEGGLIFLVTDTHGEQRYERAVEWIREHFFQEALADPTTYGFAVEQNSILTARNQILLQVPTLARTRPQMIDALIDRLFELHGQHAYSDLSGIGHTSLKKEDDLPIIPVGLVGAAAIGISSFVALRKFWRRRELGILEQRLREELPTSLRFRQMVDDLQLKTAKQKVDRAKQGQALRALADRARHNEAVQRLYEEVRTIIGVEPKSFNS